MKRQRSRSRSHGRKCAFEYLESRELLTTVVSGFVRVTYFDQITDERGKSTTVYIDLLQAPTSNVTFTVNSSNTAEGTVSTGSVTLGPSNWGGGVNITVTGKDDPAPGVDDGDKAYGVYFGIISSSDPAYSGQTIPAVPLTNLDDDVQANGCVVPNSPYLEDSQAGEAWITNADTDLSGNNSWHITTATMTAGSGTVHSVRSRFVDFEPTPDWYGNVSFNYTIVNEWGDTSSATSTLTVTNVPDKPVAVQDAAVTTLENIAVDMMNVVGNDTDADNWPAGQPANYGLTVQLTDATGGTADIINGGLGIKFTPNYGWNSDNHAGEFSVTYKVKDPQGNVSDNEITIPITVQPKNAKPRANAQSGLSTDEDTELALSLTGDGGEDDEYANQALTFAISTQPSHGTIDPETFIYTPEPDYAGSDYFEFTVTDDDQAGPEYSLTSDVKRVDIEIIPVNDDPVAVADEEGGVEETTTYIYALSNDYDIDSTTLEITEDVGYAGYSVAGGEVLSDGSRITYTPPDNFYGIDIIYYTIIDGDGGSASSAVTVLVQNVNDPPVPYEYDDIGTVGGIGGTELLTTTGDVTLNDYDVDGDTLFVSAVGQGAHGTVTFDGPDVYYTLTDYEFVGQDSFWVTVTDGNGGYATVTTYVYSYGWEPELLAAEPPRPGETKPASLDSDALAPIVVEARARWEAAGWDVSLLDSTELRIADLDGLRLAVVMQGAVIIDSDAAGWGWFVDATPEDDCEFHFPRGDSSVARRHSESAGRMDLLTAIMHEMGHLLGVGHHDGGLMDDTLEAGRRFNPETAELAWALALDDLPGKRRSRLAVDAFFAALGN